MGIYFLIACSDCKTFRSLLKYGGRISSLGDFLEKHSGHHIEFTNDTGDTQYQKNAAERYFEIAQTFTEDKPSFEVELADHELFTWNFCMFGEPEENIKRNELALQIMDMDVQFYLKLLQNEVRQGKINPAQIAAMQHNLEYTKKRLDEYAEKIKQ